MKNKLTKYFFMLGAAVFTLFALSTSASACGWAFYQPEEPKCLREN